jgi:hypothetical protein
MRKIENQSGFRKSFSPSIFLKIVSLTNGLLKSTEFKEHSRRKASDFTRKRKLLFDELMLYMLNSYNCSTQCGLRRFFCSPQTIIRKTTIIFGGSKKDKGLSLH